MTDIAMMSAIDRLTVAVKRIEALQEALEPFARLADSYESDCEAEGRSIYWSEYLENYNWPTKEQCDNAKAVLAASVPQT